MVTDEEKREENRRKRREKKQQIQKLYEKISPDFKGNEEQWQELLKALDQYSYPAVEAVLQNTPYEKNATSINDIISETHAAVYSGKVFIGYRRMLENNPECMFADYCRGIYRHKALDYVIREIKNMNNPLYAADKGDGNRKRSGSGGWVLVRPVHDLSDRELSAEERFIQYYVDAGAQSSTNPFHIIFWCYSKILSVILGQTGCNSADTWAWEQMQSRTMNELSDGFVKLFNSTMRAVRIKWGPEYLKRLAEPYKDRPETMGEIVLTNEFTQQNAKNWVARMHEKVIKKTGEMIYRSHDVELIQMAEYHFQKKTGV